MSHNNSKSTQKRQANKDSEVPLKRSTSKTDEDSSAPKDRSTFTAPMDLNSASKQKLKIIDINNDCLQSIFRHLNIIDLLNVSDANKRLKQVTELEFCRKYRKCQVQFINIFPNPIQSINAIDVSEYKMVISGLKTCLQLLRCFGEAISDIEIIYTNSKSEFREKIEIYLAEYCSETLHFLTILHCRASHLFDAIEKPLTSLLSLSLKGCNFGNKLSLNKLFPKINNLYLHSNFYENPEILVDNYPFLIIFSTEGLDESKVKEIFRLNPQLEKLYIHSNYSPDLIRYANDHLPKLEHLSLYDLPNAFFQDNQNVIHLNNVAYFSHDSNFPYFASYSGDKMCSFPFSFSNLRKCCILNLSLNQNTLNSLAKIEDLKILKLKKWQDEGNFMKKLLKLPNLLKNVEELDLGDTGHVDIEFIIRFLRQSQSIIKCIFPKNPGFRSDLQPKIEQEWKIEWYFKFAVVVSNKKCTKPE